MKKKHLRSILVGYSAGLVMMLTACTNEGGWLSPVKVSNNIASDETAAINYDGTKIVYTSDGDGDYDIYFTELSHGSWTPPLLLTHNDTPDTMPAINDRGDTITYIGGPEDNRKIYFIEYNGGRWQDPVQITFGADNHYFPSMSSDGTKITYQAKDIDEHRFIWIVERIGGIWQQPTKLPTVTDNNMFPVINADGTGIAFYGVTNGYRDIYFISYRNASWFGPVDLSNNQVHDCQPAINADGTKIVYYSTGNIFLPHVIPGAIADICLLESQGGVWQPPNKIAAGPYYEYDPTLDAAGNRITYAESIPGFSEDVYCIELSHGSWQSPTNLTRGVTLGYRPYISGNGNTIAYYGTGNVTGVMDVDNEIYVVKYSKRFGTISGQVNNGANGQTPLADVLVLAEPGGYLAKTNAAGSFLLHVPFGRYTITLLKNCFTPASRADIGLSNAEPVSITMELIPGGNCAPSLPERPLPENHSRDIATAVSLSWECSDQDGNDDVRYDVYTGIQTLHHIELHIISGNQKDNTCSVTGLQPNTNYFWKIVARDSEGYETAGPLWNFTTGE